jgi:hypothetical protein
MRTSSRLLAALPVLLFLLTGTQHLFADSVTFDFSFSGAGISSSGSFKATLVSGDEFLVTSISGMQNGFTMTLLPPGGYAGNDNEIFSSGPFLDGSGLAFVLSNGSGDYNIYYDSSTGIYHECNSTAPCGRGDGTPISFNLAQVPEPGSMMLMGSGLIGLAGMARRKLLR